MDVVKQMKAIKLKRVIRCFEFGKREYPKIREIKNTCCFRWYARGWIEADNQRRKINESY
jgi:hypothetical protein